MFYIHILLNFHENNCGDYYSLFDDCIFKSYSLLFFPNHLTRASKTCPNLAVKTKSPRCSLELNVKSL